MPEELHNASTIYWITPVRRPRLRRHLAGDQRPLVGLRLGADTAVLVGRLGLRRRLLGRRRRRRRRWRRRRLVVSRPGGATRRARSPRRRRRSATRSMRSIGIDATASQRSTTSRGSPSRSAPSTNVVLSPSSSSASGRPSPATSATRCPAGSSNPPSGTRKTAPADARNAFGEVGSAHPSESATDAAERVRGADQRADVSRVGDVPERERDRPRLARRGDPRDGRRRSPAADARASRHRRAAPARRPRRRRAGRCGSMPAASARVDEILALADEQPALGAVPPALELADQLQARVRRGGDHARTLGVRQSGKAEACPSSPMLQPGAASTPRARPSPARRSRRRRPDR